MRNKKLALTVAFSLITFFTLPSKAESIDELIIQVNNSYAQKNYSEAISLLKKAISQDSQDSRPYYILGKIYYDQQNYDEAIKYFNEYAEKEPSKYSYVNNILAKIKEAQMKPKSPPILTTDITFEESTDTGYLNAKDTGYLVIKVKNSGRDTAKNLNVTISSENSIADLSYEKNQTIPKIEAGKEIEVKIPLIAGDDISDNQVAFKIDVLEPFYGADADSKKIILKTKAFKAPKFVITSYAVKSGGFANTIKKGTEAKIEAIIKNKGEGKALNAKATVKSLSKDAQIVEGGDFDLQTLDIGESKKVYFSVFIKKSTEISDLSFMVDLENKYAKYNSSEKMKFALEGSKNDAGKDIIVATKKEKTIQTNETKDIELVSDVDVNIPSTVKKNIFGVALIIGNKNYKNESISSVEYAHNDSLAMKEYVKKVLGFDEKNIIYLEDATQTDFITYLGSKDLGKDDFNDGVLATKVKEKTDLFVYYSGHGAPDVKDENTKTAYFVPVDADPNRIKSLGYPLNAFYDNLNKLKAKNITVVIDSCFSGGSEKGMLIKGASPIFIDVKGQYNFGKIDLFTSASGKQISSWYEDKNHSLFTYYFLKAMQLGNKADEEGEKADVNSDGKLTLDEIYKYVNTKVKDVASSKNRIQTPEIFSNNKNKPFISY